MKRDWRVVFPILGATWFYIQVLIVLIGYFIGNVLDNAFYLNIARILVGFVSSAGTIMMILAIIGSIIYKENGECNKLAFWGMVQKNTYIPIIVLCLWIVQVGGMNSGHQKFLEAIPMQDEFYGYILGTVLYSMIIMVLIGVIIALVFDTILISACYTIKAINMLYRFGHLSKASRVCLIIGSLIPFVDAICAIGVYATARNYKEEEPMLLQKPVLESEEEINENLKNMEKSC